MSGMGSGVISWGVKLLWHEVNHQPPSSAEVRNECNRTCILTYAFMARTGITLRFSCTLQIY
jgi:hypothetical protein